MKLRVSAAINVSGGTALLIWIIHLAVTLYFYYKGLYYQLIPYYWAASLALACSIPYFLAMIKKSFIPYEGSYVFLAGILVSFTAWLALSPDKIDLNLESWNYAMRLAFAGSLVFLVGYYTAFGRAIGNIMPLKRFVILDPILPRLPAKFYCIGWILRMMPRLTELGIGTLARVEVFGLPMKILNKMQGWEIMNMFTSYGICAALMIDTYLAFSPQPQLTKNQRNIVLARLIILLSVEIFYSFLSGMAGNIVRPLIFIALAYIKAKKKIPVIPIILIALFFIFYIVPFVKTFRGQYWQGAAAKDSINYAKNELSGKDDLSRKQDETLKRLSNPLEMAAICYEIRKEGRNVIMHQDSAAYFSRFVPRFLWPDKPVVDYNRLGRDLGMLSKNDYTTSIGLTFIGGLIMDSGTTGVIIGLFILGILLKILWQWLIVRSNENMFAFTVYSILIYRFIFPEDFYAIIHATLSFIIYAYFLSAFVNRGYYKRVNPAA